MTRDSVLIIEDDPTLLRGLKDNFESKGYRVSTASDGERGLGAALEEKPDLIILDVMLPERNGFEVCRVVRENDLHMPIIMVTAKGQEADIVRGLNLGADDYVTKPFSISELLARANAFLRRHRTGAVSEYVFGDLRLDLSAHRLTRNDEEVMLTPKEFQLLEYLISRAGRALTRDDIMDRVWSGVFVTGRSVDRCITTLRGKIEPDARTRSRPLPDTSAPSAFFRDRERAEDLVPFALTRKIREFGGRPVAPIAPPGSEDGIHRLASTRLPSTH